LEVKIKEQIIIPFFDLGQKDRRDIFQFVYNYYSEFFDVFVCTDTLFPPSVARARNNGVKETRSNILTIIDADVIIPKEQIFESIEIARQYPGIVKPFSYGKYISEKSSKKIIKKGNTNTDFIEENAEYVENNYGSKFHGFSWVIKRKTWEEIGGMLEIFPYGSFEDSHFHNIVQNFFRPTIYVEGSVYSFFHKKGVSDFEWEKIENLNTMLTKTFYYNNKEEALNIYRKINKIYNITEHDILQLQSPGILNLLEQKLLC